jgi:regulator of replication initiation timing
VKKSKNERVNTMEEDLDNLKSEIGEIKSLLKELVNGK